MTTLLALAFATPAFAWKHLEPAMVWCDPDEMPIQYYVSDYVEDSIEAGYPNIAIQNAYDEWTENAACASVGGTYVGVGQNIGTRSDGRINFSFDDPADAYASGVLAVTEPRPGGGGRLCFVLDGSAYYSFTDADIIFNDNIDWATEEQIESGACNGETSLQAVATHEIGHQLGMGHSCDQGDACTNNVYREATMYWTGAPCDSAQTSINEDDIEGITRLYGPSAAIACSNELNPDDPATLAFGVVPFELRCSVISEDREEIDGALTEWNWGDGGQSTGLDVSHTYETAGNYTLQAEVHGTNDECGEWTNTARKVGYVRACSVPEPEFTYDHVNGLTYKMVNDTNVSVYGCIYDIAWDVFAEGASEPIATLKAWEPEYTFPEEGNYRLVLNIGGPAGTGAAELMIEVANRRGEGYGCATGGIGAGLIGASIAGALLRRRR